MKKLLLLLTPFIFFSCEKVLEIQPANLKPLLVVDGIIEDGQGPNIVLSSSLNYFSAINLQTVAGSLVGDAVVTLSDGASTQRLKAYTTPIGFGYNLIHYANDSSNTATQIIGKQGGNYTLTIMHNGSSYVSKTTIPVLAKTIDSLWWINTPSVIDSNEVLVMAKVKDPIGYGNYIRYFVKVDNGNFLAPSFSVFDDQIVDGKTYDVQLEPGIDRNLAQLPEEDDFFFKGDTVSVKHTNIDKASYDFWRTVEFFYQNIGNPFSSPTKVLGNVSNGALGAFCGYSVQYKTLIIPK